MRLPVRHPCSSPLSPQSPENRGAATEKREGGGGVGAGTGASGPAPGGEDPGQVRKIRMNPISHLLSRRLADDSSALRRCLCASRSLCYFQCGFRGGDEIAESIRAGAIKGNPGVVILDRSGPAWPFW